MENPGYDAIDIITDPHFISDIPVFWRQNYSSKALCNYNNRFFRLHAFQMILRLSIFLCIVFSPGPHRLRYSKFGVKCICVSVWLSCSTCDIFGLTIITFMLNIPIVILSAYCFRIHSFRVNRFHPIPS